MEEDAISDASEEVEKVKSEEVEDVYERPSQEETEEILESVKLEESNPEETVEEHESSSEGLSDVDKLYAEFSSFLKVKADISPEEGVKSTIPTGIEVLDAILGGGFAIGSMNIIVGQPGSGKSMLAIQTMASAQLKHKSLIAAFLDSEEATTVIRMSNLGVRNPKIKPYSGITVEKVFKLLEGICLFKEEKKTVDIPSVVIWDSIANTLSQKEMEVEDINSVIGYKARLLSILIPKYVAKCARYNILFLAVNQLRDVMNIGPFSAPKELKFMSTGKDMPGGNILRFNAFQLVDLKIKSALKPEMYGFDGILVTAKTVKNKLFSPNVSVNLIGDFRTGFSNFWTNYNFLVETKRLQAGSWNFLVSTPEKKFRTKDSLHLYDTDSEFKKAFDDAVKEAIQKDLVEKYNPEVQSSPPTTTKS